MKKLISIYIITILAIIASSCEEDVLDKKPLDIISDAVVWNDPNLIDAFFTNVYYRMTILTNEVADNSVWGGDSWFNITQVIEISDEALGCWTQNTSYAYRFGLDISGEIYGQWALLPWWEESYKIIRSLNEFIERIPSSPVDENYKIARLAEARFLRAYNYFSMVKRYGGIPLITKVQNANDPEEELFPHRAKEKEVYDFVISEMALIADDLPEVRDSPEYGRPTKFAALALQCRAALYAGSIAQYGNVELDGIVGIESIESKGYYEQAYEAAKTIMETSPHGLYKQYADNVINFQNIFLDKNNVEVIFARVHDEVNGDEEGQGWAWDFFQGPVPNGYGQGLQSGPYLEVVEAFEYTDGTPGTLDPETVEQRLWTYDELWANKDPRFFASIYTHGTSWQGKILDHHNGLMLPDGTIKRSGSYEGVLARGNQRPNGNFGTSFGIKKYLDETKSTLEPKATSNQDWIVFRYAEILLNFAEAAFELGYPDEALDAVNQIRNRAGIAELSSIDRDQIRHERRVELLFEGHRYWDLRRWRIAEELLSKSYSGLRYILDYETGKFWITIQRDIDGTVKKPVFFPRNYYLPITLQRTGKNPNLVENPGY